MNTVELITKTAQETAQAVVKEFKHKGMIKGDSRTPFQKTEMLLYNYNSFKDAIADKYKQIETITQEGIAKKSCSITSYSGNEGLREIKDDNEKAEEQIAQLEQSIVTTKCFIQMIDNALDVISKDTYFEALKMNYFEGKNREEIANYYGCDARTITRNKNRLINILQVRLFSDDVIRGLMG